MLNKKFILIFVFIFFVLIGAAGFPIYNLNKQYSFMNTILILISTVMLYYSLGIYEKIVLTNVNIKYIITLNLGIIVLSMICRYLLEFGEVSNTYNFTIPNIALHIFATIVISSFSWYISKPQR